MYTFGLSLKTWKEPIFNIFSGNNLNWRKLFFFSTGTTLETVLSTSGRRNRLRGSDLT